MSLLLQTKLRAETLHEHVGLCQALENVSMAVRGSKNTSVNEAIAERKENVSSLRDDLLSVLRGLRKVRESEQEVQNRSAQTVVEACHGCECKDSVGAIDMPRTRLGTADVDSHDVRAEDDTVGEGCVVENLLK